MLTRVLIVQVDLLKENYIHSLLAKLVLNEFQSSSSFQYFSD